MWQTAVVSTWLSDLLDGVDIVVYCGCGYTCSKMFTRSNFVRELILHFSTVASEKVSHVWETEMQHEPTVFSSPFFLSFLVFFSCSLDVFLSNLTCCPAGEGTILNVMYNSGRLIRFSHFGPCEIVLKAWKFFIVTVKALRLLFLQNCASKDEFEIFYICNIKYSIS